MKWTTVFGILTGGLLVITGGILALSPEILPSDIWQQIFLHLSWVEETPISYVVGGLIALASLLYLRTRTAGSQNTHKLYDIDPTQVHQPSPEIGDEFDQAVEMNYPYAHVSEHTATQQPARSSHPTSLDKYQPSVDPADSLEETLENALRQTHNTDDVTEIIDQGTWTSNQIAAASMSSNQDFPLSHRVLQWLQPDIARQREYSQTASEVYRVVADHVPDYEVDD